jgi:hypothetical protein
MLLCDVNDGAKSSELPASPALCAHARVEVHGMGVETCQVVLSCDYQACHLSDKFKRNLRNSKQLSGQHIADRSSHIFSLPQKFAGQSQVLSTQACPDKTVCM